MIYIFLLIAIIISLFSFFSLKGHLSNVYIKKLECLSPKPTPFIIEIKRKNAISNSSKKPEHGSNIGSASVCLFIVTTAFLTMLVIKEISKYNSLFSAPLLFFSVLIISIIILSVFVIMFFAQNVRKSNNAPKIRLPFGMYVLLATFAIVFPLIFPLILVLTDSQSLAQIGVKLILSLSADFFINYFTFAVYYTCFIVIFVFTGLFFLSLFAKSYTGYIQICETDYKKISIPKKELTSYVALKILLPIVSFLMILSTLNTVSFITLESFSIGLQNSILELGHFSKTLFMTSIENYGTDNTLNEFLILFVIVLLFINLCNYFEVIRKCYYNLSYSLSSRVCYDIKKIFGLYSSTLWTNFISSQIIEIVIILMLSAITKMTIGFNFSILKILTIVSSILLYSIFKKRIIKITDSIDAQLQESNCSSSQSQE